MTADAPTTWSCRRVPALAGHAVGVTGHRRSDELASHLRALGATVVHGPVLHTAPITDDHRELRAATDALLARPPDVLLVTTGIGLRSWMNAAGAWGLDGALLRALSHTRILARGPKALGAIAEIGLLPSFAEPSGGTDAMVEHLLTSDVRGVRVALQLPGAAMPAVVGRLQASGADVVAVPIYDWTWPDDLAPGRRLLRAVVEGRLSALTFTSRPAVRNLVALAASEGVEDAVGVALRGPVVPVCIGAVTADALRELTGAAPVQPERAKLGALAPAVAAAVARTGHHHIETERGHVVVQRRVVACDGALITMSDREAAVLAPLVAAGARTVGRDELLRAVWRGETVDASVLETTMARLRRRIARTGLRVHTITSRGYLLDGVQRACPAVIEPDPDHGLSAAIGD